MKHTLLGMLAESNLSVKSIVPHPEIRKRVIAFSDPKVSWADYV
jgi:hypothetical protein